MLTRLLGYDRTTCSVHADTPILIMKNADVGVNANAVGRRPVEQVHQR